MIHNTWKENLNKDGRLFECPFKIVIDEIWTKNYNKKVNRRRNVVGVNISIWSPLFCDFVEVVWVVVDEDEEDEDEEDEDEVDEDVDTLFDWEVETDEELELVVLGLVELKVDEGTEEEDIDGCEVCLTTSEDGLATVTVKNCSGR